MCQVLCGKLGVADGSVDLRGECVERALEGWGDGAGRGRRGGQAGAQEAIVAPGEEQGDAEAKVGNAIAEAVGHALDHAVQPQPAQLVGDGALRYRDRIAAREGSEMVAQSRRAEALRELPEQNQRMEERMNARI